MKEKQEKWKNTEFWPTKTLSKKMNKLWTILSVERQKKQLLKKPTKTRKNE